MSKGCVCGVCEFGPDSSEVPKKPSWETDVFCTIGRQEIGSDGIVRSIPDYVRPFFSNDSAPSACPKMQAYVQLMAARSKLQQAA
jgi:hypothetical protein